MKVEESMAKTNKGARRGGGGRSSMKLESLKELFLHELTDLYDAEKQLVKALPKMAQSASDARLRQAIEDHLDETEAQVERLEDIFERLQYKPKARTCKGMKGIVEEGSEMMKEKGDDAVIDAGLISAAQRVEHYEIAAYGTARAYAEMLGDEESAEALETTLDEEKATDERLNDLAMQLINPKAKRARSDEAEEGEEEGDEGETEDLDEEDLDEEEDDEEEE
jgi:ferritin-like metal-binding protein YciE